MTMVTTVSGLRSDTSTYLFEKEENHAMTQHQGGDIEPGYDVTPTGTLNFGTTSYLTPHTQVRDSSLSLNPPLIARKNNLYDRNECKIHQTVSISIPLL